MHQGHNHGTISSAGLAFDELAVKRADKAEEIEKVGVLEGVVVVGGRGRAFPFLDGDELARVAREGDALKQRAGNLAGEFARGPSLRGGLLEIEAAALRAALSGSRR